MCEKTARKDMSKVHTLVEACCLMKAQQRSWHNDANAPASFDSFAQLISGIQRDCLTPCTIDFSSGTPKRGNSQCATVDATP